MPPQPRTMRNRWTAYAALSTTLAGGVILKSLAQRPNFYSAAVYLSQSSANLMILCNLVFVTACSALLLLQKFLYGPLRPIEVEQLYEKAWFAVTETCLAMTIFRGEIGAWFLVMFFSLLAGKVWGWIGEGRVEVLEQQQHNIVARGATLFHTRLAASLILSVLFDSWMLEYTVGQVLHMARPDMMVMFGFEFAVLTITSVSTSMRYALNLVEIAIVRKQKQKRIDAIRKERVDAAIRELQAQQESPQGAETIQEEGADPVQQRTQAAEAAASQPIDEADVEVEGWEGKGRWVFYLDLTTDFCKLVIYLSFFFILLIFYGLPLHIMRDVFLTCRSFFKRIGDFVRYRNATKDMNERYPDATEAEIGREDVCIICREEMRLYLPPAQGAARDPVAERMRPKKLPCGHVLHFSCLRSWLERQQICPTCRATVVPTPQPGQGTAARAQGAPARAQHPQNGGNGRPRVYQFGPLRIGVGAVRGNDMFEQLEQQLANLNPAPAQGQDANGPQQYGFGIRWDGMRRRVQGTHRNVRGTVDDQLNAVERQIQREVDTLQASMGELQALRNVQAQLARIRMARQAAAQPQQPGQAQGLPQTNPLLRPVVPAITSLVPNQQQNILQAGSDQLPQGLTLPEGWSMMPLQPVQQPQIPAPGGFHAPMAMPFNMPGMPQMQFIHPPGAHGHVPPSMQMPQNVDVESAIRQSSGQPQDAIVQAEQSQQQAATPGQAQPTVIQEETPRTRENPGIAQTTPQIDAASSQAARVPTPASSIPALSAPSSNVASVPRAPPQAQRPSSTQETESQVIPRPAPGTSTSAPKPPKQASTTGTPSTSNTITNINPPQRLAPMAQSRPANFNGLRTSSTSPHRPTRSIGSSWGFSGVEDHDDDDDDDADDDEEDEEEEEDTTGSEHEDAGRNRPLPRPNGTNGTSTRSAGRGGRSPIERGPRKGKSTTVEDLVEDPD